jgi:CRISPR/Cas system endoribonuclease Cas6 (RAMP superfamily)
MEGERRSNQQKTKLKMGGFTGDITLDGDLEPFTSLLRLSEVLHVGKGTVFGLGKMVLNDIDNTCKH